jgi:hypothetical protein
MIQLDGTLTERGKRAGETAKRIEANADLLLNAKPRQALAAVVVNPWFRCWADTMRKIAATPCTGQWWDTTACFSRGISRWTS